MGPKLEIALTTHSLEELAPIASEYSIGRLLERTQLFGGYSGSNYRVNFEDGSTYVLKITNGYTAKASELMCRTAYHLGTSGCSDCCLPILRRDADAAASSNDGDANFRFVSLKEKRGEPAFLLTFVQGTQADKVMREQPHLATNVMSGIGGGLARMHAAARTTREEAQRLGLRWYEKDGGCCDVQDQVNGTVLATIEQCREVQGHEFVPFYRKELALLRSEMKLAKDMPMGITHGDPFADNVLVKGETGELAAFIDMEDVCVGPLLFDLACCAIGCCFNDSPGVQGAQVLDMQLFEALLGGYCTDRKLTQTEREHFVPFMRLTLLCNCCWRFVKFNVQSSTRDDDVPEEAKISYLELQKRIEYLQDPEVVQKIKAVVEKST